jgi:type II pantothenate kinase
MVVQSIGSSAVFSAMNSEIKDFVMIGNLTKLPQCKMVFPLMERIYGVKFHIPPHAEFRTALGAALAFKK